VLLITPGSKAENLDSYLKSKNGESLFHKGKFDEAAKAYESAHLEDPENPQLSFNRGTALAQSKNNEEATLQLQDATKKALSQGDFETAAKSLYNEGLIHHQNQSMKESFDRLTKAIELAKRSGLTDLEERARKVLSSAFQQQKQNQSKSSQDQKDKEKQNKNQDKKEEKGDDQDTQKKKNQPTPEDSDGRKRQFKGKTLSKDVAESLMNDLSDREKQLYQRRLGDKKGREVPNDKDW
jgi:Ca-activated chloride channel family protein